MKKHKPVLTTALLNQSRRTISKIYFPRIALCLNALPEEAIWWRPNEASNSVGNLVLHLEGNVRQWIISGLGGKADHRDRDHEFAERGPVSCSALLARLQKTVAEADRILEKLDKPSLRRRYVIQKFKVTGIEAVCHVAEHFAFHAGQIIYITKLKQGEDLGFTRLPGVKQSGSQKNLPSV